MMVKPASTSPQNYFGEDKFVMGNKPRPNMYWYLLGLLLGARRYTTCERNCCDRRL